MTLTAQDLIQMQKLVASATVIQSGALKEELDAIAKASVELETKLTIVKTLEDADAYRAQVTKDMADQKAILDEAMAQHQVSVKSLIDERVELELQKVDVSGKMQEATNREATTTQDAAALAAEQAMAKDAMHQAHLDNDLEKQKLVDRENAIKVAETALADRIAKLATI